jgi:hypothetical protein
MHILSIVWQTHDTSKHYCCARGCPQTTMSDDKLSYHIQYIVVYCAFFQTNFQVEEGMRWLDDCFHLIRCQDDELPSIDWVLDLARAAVLRCACSVLGWHVMHASGTSDSFGIAREPGTNCQSHQLGHMLQQQLYRLT